MSQPMRLKIQPNTGIPERQHKDVMKSLETESFTTTPHVHGLVCEMYSTPDDT